MKLFSHLRPHALLLALLLGSLALACQEGSSEVEFETDNSIAGSGVAGSGVAGANAALLSQLPHASQAAIRHAGQRTFESWDWTGDTPHTTKFREQIFNDGEGNYSIDAIAEIEGTEPDWVVFQLLQGLREGLVFKYRDFATRDPRLFLQNWQLTDTGAEEFVAGRRCGRYLVDRIVGVDRAYSLSIDKESGLILRYHEQDNMDRTLSLLEYETVDYDPDLSGVVWYDEEVRTEIDGSRAFEDQVGFQPLEPSLLPLGYDLHRAEIAVANDEKWLSIEYTDGVDSLFFLQRFPLLQGHGGSDVGVVGGTSRLAQPDLIHSFQIGSATALQGTVAGHELIVVGKVIEVELLDMVESSLD